VLAALSAGGTCVVPPGVATATPAALATFLETKHITVLHATPPLLRLLLAALHDSPRRLDALRLVVSGGAPLTAGLVRGLRGCSAAEVVNAYGLTESPQIAAWHPVTGTGAVSGATALPIGRAVPGGQLLVRTPDGRPAAPGQRGELVLRGGRLALGYLDGAGRDGTFGTDPDGTPVLYTGDLARIDPAGLVHLDGRADRQIQLHGFRIEPASVEAAAARHPLVDHAVARLRTEAESATLELEVSGTGALEPDDLLRHLRAALPPYAVPTAVRITGLVALNANNKPAVAPLPSTVEAPPEMSDVDTARHGPVLAAVREVLGRDIPVTRNFFDAGLTSMSLLRLRDVLARRLGRPVRVTDLFEHPTVRALTARLAGPAVEPAPPAAASRADPGVPAWIRRRRRSIRRTALLPAARST
jgi:acyl-CoA synthetase (AMP-forming)/AMP-acid ligase II